MQGWDYFLRFIRRFPDVQSLADAEEDEVLKLWQGLGYYSRARNMHAAAKQIVNRFKGSFPRAYPDILSLKGVGEYSAAAISSIAFNKPFAVVDGNVVRVLSRLFAVETGIHTSEGKKQFLPSRNCCSIRKNRGSIIRRSWISDPSFAHLRSQNAQHVFFRSTAGHLMKTAWRIFL